jgi:8-hydroxy-5-deazaflavin:NADPH oxidoreductase
MKVGIIGAGNIGANLARQWLRRGHDVLLSYKRDAKQLEELASELGTRWGTPGDAAAHGEVVLLATPWSVLDDIADRVSLDRTIVIDATNPFVAGGLAPLPAGTSAGAANAERFAVSRLVKAFNTYTARFQRAVGNGEHGHPVAMFLSGEEADAKQNTQSLVRDAGFEPVDLGGFHQMPLMEAPRREGAVYGEAYSPDAARQIARAASSDLAEAARLATLLREAGPEEADRA